MTLTLCVRILRDMRRGCIELILSYVINYVENKLSSYLPACFPRPNNQHVPSIINGCHVLIGQEQFFYHACDVCNVVSDENSIFHFDKTSIWPPRP